jgi:hypothetical protein
VSCHSHARREYALAPPRPAGAPLPGTAHRAQWHSPSSATPNCNPPGFKSDPGQRFCYLWCKKLHKPQSKALVLVVSVTSNLVGCRCHPVSTVLHNCLLRCLIPFPFIHLYHSAASSQAEKSAQYLAPSEDSPCRCYRCNVALPCRCQCRHPPPWPRQKVRLQSTRKY